MRQSVSTYVSISVHTYGANTLVLMLKKRSRMVSNFRVARKKVLYATLHRLQTHNEAFFNQNPKLLGLGR